MRRMGLWLVLLLALGITVSDTAAQGGVRAVVTSEVANVRIIPALGAAVRGSVPAGFLIDPVTARSAQNDWLRFDYLGDEGWINISTLAIIDGSLESLPVADPRTIPYGGFEAPRAGTSSNTNGPTAQVIDWLRVRSGPGQGYLVIANAPINSQVVMLGRTASGNWIQVNYQNTLGWVSREWLTFPVNFTLSQLPIDGVIASEPPRGDNPEDFIGTLRLMRDRLDLAQPSLDTIRAYWTDAALTGRASCQPYPAQPSDFNIPDQLLAAYFTTLDPLRTQFNDAMFNLRYAIDLFIAACEQPGTVNPVGQAQATGALEVVSLADRQFADLRRQLNELIPSPEELGAGECLLSFGGAVEILPVIGVGQLVIDSLTPQQRAVGYCFDATEGQTLLVDLLQKPGGNASFLITVSPFDNPTAFTAIGRSGAEDLLRTGPITIPTSGRYLVIVSGEPTAESDAPLGSDFGLLIYTAGGEQSGGLAIDPVTGEIVILVIIPALATPTPIGGGGGFCPDITASCAQLTSCEAATACLPFNPSLDPDGNGIPCEAEGICTAGP